jgi:hypothetical protein
MQFVRTIVESNRLVDIVDIPTEFKNKKVEVLILPFHEKKRPSKKKKKFNPEDFEGILNIDKRDIEKEIKRMRNEWERI